MRELPLAGCRSRPLVGYLKALGLLRIVARQADPAVRGRWRNGVLELRTDLGVDELRTFLLDRYAPTPILSPWNGRSGFYPRGNVTALENLARIERADDVRFGPYRALVEQTRALLDDEGLTEKPVGAKKERLLRRLRREWPDEAVEWLDATVVLAGGKVAFPPGLGSGGNDGSYDFSSNLMEALAEVLLGDREASASLLGATLHDTPTQLARTGLAHLQRDASPTNSPWGEAPPLGNPWDLVLGVEGTLVLTAGAVRRHATAGAGALAAPFAVRPTGAGYGSAIDGESGRAELWLPLWDGWTGLAEITVLAREFRAQVSDGRSLRRATTGLDLARAAGELGVARGISAFERFALLERAGQSTLAVSAGRVSVKSRPGPRALEGLDRWLTKALDFGAGEHCPVGPRTAIRRLQQAVYEMTTRDDPAAACEALEALGQVESSLVRSGVAAEGVSTVPSASAAAWIAVADDGSHELAMAVAIGSLRDPRGRRLPALRDYLHGTRRGERGTEFDPQRRHAVAGGDPAALLAALQARRHLDAARAEGDPSRLGYSSGIPLPLDTARMFAAGMLDDRRILALLRGLALLRYSGKEAAPKPSRHRQAPPQPAFELIALSWHGIRKGDPRVQRSKGAEGLGARPGWAARLTSGATRSVAENAMLRLRMAGLPPRLASGDLLLGLGSAEQGRRVGAALLPRLGPRDLRRLMEAQISSPQENDETKEEE